MPTDPDPATIAAVVLDLVRGRGPGKSICPSEAARVLAGPDGEWRWLMPAVREVAARLGAAGALVATQRGQPVDPLLARGPIRLALAPGGEQVLADAISLVIREGVLFEP